MSVPFSVLVILCLVGLAVRTAYELLKRDGKLDPRSKVVFGVVFAAMVLMLLSWPFLCPLDPLPLALPAAVRWAGLFLAFGGVFQLRGLENIDHLVTSGLYARLRHPMYTGFILWILGWVIFSGGMVSLAVGVVAIGNVLFWRKLEAEKLEVEWGDEYKRYQMESWF